MILSIEPPHTRQYIHTNIYPTPTTPSPSQNATPARPRSSSSIRASRRADSIKATGKNSVKSRITLFISKVPTLPSLEANIHRHTTLNTHTYAHTTASTRRSSRAPQEIQHDDGTNDEHSSRLPIRHSNKPFHQKLRWDIHYHCGIPQTRNLSLFFFSSSSSSRRRKKQ